MIDLIIPKPQKIELHEGKFILDSKVVIYSSVDTIFLARYFQNILKNKYDLSLEVITESRDKNVIYLKSDFDPKDENEEDYSLEITPERINLAGLSIKGLFYAIQSLRQLIEVNKDELIIPAQKIFDFPRFPYRGFMFDVGRHYHPIETIKKIIDILALLKMNVFHWHLTEDQGWRIEIKKYPKLVEIGSKRKDTLIGGYMSKKYRGEPHEGYYTQKEIQDVVQYAKERFIEVIPEIEIPGHCTAALASYPELSCTGEQIDVKMKSGIFSDIYCAGKESTFEFLENVLDEVIELFPSEIIHIGGDEAPKKRWKDCPDCQKRIQDEGLEDVHELQVYFTNRISEYLKTKSKRIMGWNQILGDTLESTAIVHWWLGKPKNKVKYLKRGWKFVMSNMPKTYLDHSYLFFPLRQFYNFDPIPKNLPSKYHANILGVETPIWTEWVPNLDRLGWQIFPRLLAVAEVAWTEKSRKNLVDFKNRLPSFLKFLDELQLPYANLEEVDPSKWKRYTRMHKWFDWPEV